MTDGGGRAAPIDQLLERAVGALNRGDVTIAHDLAEEVLAADGSNRDAAALLDFDNPSARPNCRRATSPSSTAPW